MARESDGRGARWSSVAREGVRQVNSVELDLGLLNNGSHDGKGQPLRLRCVQRHSLGCAIFTWV